MKRDPLDYAVSVLVAPTVGLIAASIIRQGIESAAAPEVLADLGQYCLGERDGGLCSLLGASSMLLWSASVLLLVAMTLPLLCFVAIRRLSANRNVLARRFASILQGYLSAVALLLAAQGCLVLFSGYELVMAGDFNPYLLICIGLLAVGMFSSAVAIVSDMPLALIIEPLQVTAVVLLDGQLEELKARIVRVAEQLAVPVPSHIVIGLEPRVFATAAEIRLRGEGELCDTVTLHVSAPALRVLSDTELDALVARELAAMHAETPVFTRQFVPLCASVAAVISYLETDSEHVGAIAKIARLPAKGFLAAMRSSLQAAQRPVRLQREQEADRAALRVVEPTILLSALAKATALELRWNAFRRAYQQYMLSGQQRRNLALDYLTYLARFVVASDPAALRANLLAAHLPDVFAASTVLAERARQHAVSIEPILTDLCASLSREPQRDALLVRFEEQLTMLENDYFRVPGQRVVLNTQESLPAQLAVI